MTNLDSMLKSRHYFANKDLSSHVWMWELDYKESWVPKNWCFWTVVLEKTLERLFSCKKSQLVHPEGNQSWTFIGRTDAEAETPILWPPDTKYWLIWKRPWPLLGLLAKIKCEKDPDSGRDWRWEEKGMTEDEVVRWHYQFNGHEFEVTPGVGDGQGGLACCSPCDRKELHAIEQLNWIELMQLPYKSFLWFHYWPSINQFIHSSPVS